MITAIPPSDLGGVSRAPLPIHGDARKGLFGLNDREGPSTLGIPRRAPLSMLNRTMTGELAYFRYKVDGGEFVLEGERTWLIMFNGVRIGGMHPSPEAALEAIDRRRAKQVPGPNLAGVEDPPRDLSAWVTVRHSGR